MNKTIHLKLLHANVLGFYGVLAILFTFPLAIHFLDHVPGSETWGFDEYTFVWNLWWFKHAVFDLGVGPLQTNLTFYPIGVNLILYTFTLLNAVLAIPIEFVLGYPAASNTLLLFSFVSGGYGAFVLAAFLLRRMEYFHDASTKIINLAALSAGVVFAFASSRFVYAALGHYNFVCSQYLPFYVLFLIKSTHETRGRNACLL